ncbi:sensor histidine kinase [Sphingobacterium bambusae]|uniref:histidine kinase n=1 Tax=Sphingobacterium bambusae TaxID=662858 RepID=A0ABW6BBU6_9SPHI|nr:ATP-binding protein [Sphingobacterium bambusae]WPL48276.1 ATP-binding protein [Sphingobacterium bambusae]
MSYIGNPLFQALFQGDIPRLIVGENTTDCIVVDYNSAYELLFQLDASIDYRGSDCWLLFGHDNRSESRESALTAALQQASNLGKSVCIKVGDAGFVMQNDRRLLQPEDELEILPVYSDGNIPAYFILSWIGSDTYLATKQLLNKEELAANMEQQHRLADSLAKEQALVEEMTALNDELSATVEELSATNEELLASQHSLNSKHEELLASEERFRLLIRQAPVGICVIRSSDLKIVEVNDGYLTLVGKKRENLAYKMVWDAIPEAASFYGPIMDEVIRSGMPFVATEHELLLIRFDQPETVWVDFVYEPVIADNGMVNAVLVLAIDVTEKVKSRKAIEEAGERTRLAVESAEIGTFEYNYDTDKVLTSARFDDIFDVARPDSRAQLLGNFHPDDVHLSAEAHAVAARDGKMMYEARILRRDQSVHWIRVHAKVFYHRDGTAHKLLGTVLDVTTHKQLQHQKDDFISIASHELKTPITSLKASLQFLMRIQDRKDVDLSGKLLQQANRSMERISKLIDDLLNVSTVNSELQLNKKRFVLNDLFTDICANMPALDRYNLLIEGDSNVSVYADEHRIEQVLVNLLNNALKYAPSSQEIGFKVEIQNQFVRVSLRDQGPGIPVEKQHNIFKRYVRADDSGIKVSGLGLGLYISADIIHRHQGEIGVESIPGEGATFWFTLPAL